jgi:L,D-transpeptidase YcbB
VSLVRDPDPQNPLGVVKFLFPNKYLVYMHDTPAKDLFEGNTLAASSGCVRLSKARELAYYIMKRDRGWGSAKVDSIISAGKTKRFDLKNPIMVHIQYFTSWVDKAGQLQFRRDIYGRDVNRTTRRKHDGEKKQKAKQLDW